MEIDDLLDDFESSWVTSGHPPNLRSILRKADSSARRALACELIEIDLERRWRTEPRHRRTVGDYVMELPDVKFAEADLVPLLATEFVVRNLWGDCPQPSMIPLVGGCNREAVDAALDLARSQVPWPSVRFVSNGAVVLEAALDRPAAVGRQSAGDPAPVTNLQKPESQRLIIAPSADPTISRTQLQLKLATIDRVALTNASKNRSLAIQTRQALIPGETVEYPVPVVIPLGSGRAIAVGAANTG